MADYLGEIHLDVIVVGLLGVYVLRKIWKHWKVAEAKSDDMPVDKPLAKDSNVEQDTVIQGTEIED